MIHLTKEVDLFSMRMGDLRLSDPDKQVIVFYRKGLMFAFNFSPTHSYTDIKVPLPAIADYTVALCTDDGIYGGFDQVQHITYPAQVDEKGNSTITLYLPARTAVVLKEMPKVEPVKEEPEDASKTESVTEEAPQAAPAKEEKPKKPRKPRTPKDPDAPKKPRARKTTKEA